MPEVEEKLTDEQLAQVQAVVDKAVKQHQDEQNIKMSDLVPSKKFEEAAKIIHDIKIRAKRKEGRSCRRKADRKKKRQEGNQHLKWQKNNSHTGARQLRISRSCQ